jgi:hypothetical protein
MDVLRLCFKRRHMRTSELEFNMHTFKQVCGFIFAEYGLAINALTQRDYRGVCLGEEAQV